MKRAHSLEQRGPRGMLQRIGRAPTPRDRQQGDLVLSLLSDDEDENGNESGTEPGDGYRKIGRGVEQMEIFDSDDENGTMNRQASVPIDLTEIDDEDGLQDQAHFERDVQSIGAIGANLPPDHEHLDFAMTVFGQRVRPNDTGEIECSKDAESSQDASFFRIVAITADRSGRIFVHGIPLKRRYDVDRKLSKLWGGPLYAYFKLTLNELCAVLRVPAGSTDVSLESALEIRPIEDIGLLRSTTFTNKPYVDLCGFTKGEMWRESIDEEKREKKLKGHLFCRWKYVQEIDTKRKKAVRFQFRELEPCESDPGQSVSLERKFELFRGHKEDSQQANAATPRGKRKREPDVITIGDSDEENGFTFGAAGSSRTKKTVRQSVKTQSTRTVISRDGHGNEHRSTVETRQESTSVRHHREKYTYGEICAGAGGTSAGAQMAGFDVRYLVDIWEDACETLKLNFPNAAVLQMDLSDFIQKDTHHDTRGNRVDVMHVSLPCPGHSTANRGKNEEMDAENIAFGYGTLCKILAKCKPRIVTMEQVRGIMTKNEGQHLRVQIAALTTAGYSVRSSLLNFAEYSNVHARPRVILIAACPGQSLPPYPERTHGTEFGLRPFTTIADILAQVPRHPPRFMLHAVPRNNPPYSPNQMLKGCIMTGGVSSKASTNYHPSGKRDFNLQELATMQGFRPEHKFYNGGVSSVRRQIGNAYSSDMSMKVFKAAIPALKETDRRMEDEARRKAAEARVIAKRNEEAAKKPIVLE